MIIEDTQTNTEERFTKWRARGINKKELLKIREGLRSRAKTILKQNHIKEYKRIIKTLYYEELKKKKIIYNKKEFLKGGLK